MYFVPPNLAASCTVQTTITSCQPPTFMFLQLITQLFGNSLDAQYSSGQSGYNFGTSYNNYYDRTSDYNSDEYYNPQSSQEYDFIVVGAGTAGCVLANRLTEIPQWRVLLLEAGDEEPEAADVPAFAPTLQQSNIDWGFMTQPNPYSCLARQNGQCAWARGKVMGGSSTINYMIYLRGNPIDYDEWAANGNPGWSYRDVLPYFKKSEDNHNVPDVVSPTYHGTGGYLSVEQFTYRDQNVNAMLQAFSEAGLPLYDQNSGPQIGASLLQTTSRNGRRESANVAFIRPIRNQRRNLVIQTNAYATRILINPQTKVAYGVEYVRNGRMTQAFAKKEVIAACGSIMTPKLLMLSGIGPAQHLQSFGIQVLQNLPVGYNLMDHPTIDNLLFQISNQSSTLATFEQEAQDANYYKEERAGPLSSTGPLQLNAFVQTKYETEPGRPDIQYSIDCGNTQDIVTAPVLASDTKVDPLAYYDCFIIRPVLLNEASRGVIKLNSTDPLFGYPIIYPNTFSQEIDVLRMVEGIKQALNLLKTPSLQKLGVSLVTTPMPACDQFIFGTDQYWTCLVRSYTTTMYHFTGTCKMGPRYDRTTVVDPRLRVHGIRNLRVIDSSIMPRVPRGNTNAPTFMIAEKGSDFLKETWLKQKLNLGLDLKQMIRNLFFGK